MFPFNPLYFDIQHANTTVLLEDITILFYCTKYILFLGRKSTSTKLPYLVSFPKQPTKQESRVWTEGDDVLKYFDVQNVNTAVLLKDITILFYCKTYIVFR